MEDRLRIEHPLTKTYCADRADFLLRISDVRLVTKVMSSSSAHS